MIRVFLRFPSVLRELHDSGFPPRLSELEADQSTLYNKCIGESVIKLTK
jgi:hypothetical protein